MQERLASFVPAADEVHRLKKIDSPEGELFRKIAEQGHYAGRTRPTTTRQGIYATAPSGELLASVNTRSAERVLAMLDEALEAWGRMPEGERYLSADQRPDRGGWRWRELYPVDGLVLRVHSRDLPRDDPPDDWRADASNRDYAWFRGDELRGSLPQALTPGARRAVADPIVRRLARLHLVDNVRGQCPAFADAHVERAELTAEVAATDGGRVELALEGSTRTVARGKWPVAGYRDMHDPAEQERGVETSLRGQAVWDTESGRFVAFELLALGTRWGGTQYNGRGDDLAPGRIGFAFVLAGDDERVAPAPIRQYGWQQK